MFQLRGEVKSAQDIGVQARMLVQDARDLVEETVKDIENNLQDYQDTIINKVEENVTNSTLTEIQKSQNLDNIVDAIQAKLSDISARAESSSADLTRSLAAFNVQVGLAEKQIEAELSGLSGRIPVIEETLSRSLESLHKKVGTAAQRIDVELGKLSAQIPAVEDTLATQKARIEGTEDRLSELNREIESALRKIEIAGKIAQLLEKQEKIGTLTLITNVLERSFIIIIVSFLISTAGIVIAGRALWKISD